MRERNVVISTARMVGSLTQFAGSMRSSLKPRGRLLDHSAGLLDDEQTVRKAKLEIGNSLTLQLWRVQIQASAGEFAAILTDGSVVTWGHELCGADSCGHHYCHHHRVRGKIS